MEPWKLSELAASFGATPYGAESVLDTEITEICSDTRAITAGCLFWAFQGERFDGNAFAADAVAKGAIAAVTSQVIPGIPCLCTLDTRAAFLKAAAAYRRKFSVRLVGVTGSVGKTTTKNMIALALSGGYHVLKTQGNLNNEIGLPKTLFQLENRHEAAVIEMGMSGFGEISRLSQTAAPDLGVITNIGYSHIERLGSQSGILKAKLEILDGMAENAPLFVNGDDPHLADLKKTLQRPVFTFGFSSDADVRAEHVEMCAESVSFQVCYASGKSSVVLPCTGEHHVRNALVAFAVGLYLKLEPEQIASALTAYTPDGLRQNITERSGQLVIADCYNASPDSMRAALSVLKQQKAKRFIAVLGDMLELGAHSEKLHRMVGHMAAEAALDRLYCYGSESKALADEAQKLGVSVWHTADREKLSAQLSSELQAGDAVLFKASRGMRLEEVISAVYSSS